MKSLSEYLFESKDLTINILKKAIDELLEGNDDDVNDSLKYFKDNGKKSIFDAFEEMEIWDYLIDLIDFMYKGKYFSPYEVIRDMVQKNDKIFTDFVNKEWGDYIDKNIR